MLSWLKAKMTEKNNLGRADICKHCVWSHSEEAAGKSKKKHKQFCGILGNYYPEYHSCTVFLEELFEGKSNSTQTEEFSLDLETSIESNDLFSNPPENPKVRDGWNKSDKY